MSGVRLMRVVSEEEFREGLGSVDPIDPEALNVSSEIVREVRKRGLEAAIEYARKFGELEMEGGKIVLSSSELQKAFEECEERVQKLLQRTAKRIQGFAAAQQASVAPMNVSITGGRAGHSLAPVSVAACYAPGGRFPLPSSVLMTAITARVAGVQTVIVASPRPAKVTLAAAYVAGCDWFVTIGGAQAIAGLAYGVFKTPGDVPIPRCDVLVGPGNRFVTAAKFLVSSVTRIDMLAGPSEVLVVADEEAKPELVAADLLAQAEHDVYARPILIAVAKDNSSNHSLLSFVKAIDNELERQLASLPKPNADIAKESLQKNGAVLLCQDIVSAAKISDQIAPEHLELQLSSLLLDEAKSRFQNYGALFIGSMSAEVFGDYGIGPNHVLPTAGTAKNTGGLSVFTFLRVRTWMNVEDLSNSEELINDAADFATLEGLHAHANAARIRSSLIHPSLPKQISNGIDSEQIRFALPKGRMQAALLSLLEEAGLGVKVASDRSYRPSLSAFPDVQVKLLNPRNVTEMLINGSRDFGFTGADLVGEMGGESKVVKLLDTELDKVRIVAAATERLLEPLSPSVNPKLAVPHLRKDKFVRIATEYPELTAKWMEQQNIKGKIVRTRGATEVFPPEDADMIVDNTATGTTLKANQLVIVDVLMQSTTCLYANRESYSNPKKRQLIDTIIFLLKAVLSARQRVILEFNVPECKLNDIEQVVPSLKRPTIAPLHGMSWFAVKTVVNKKAVPSIIQAIKEFGGSDILVSSLNYLVE